MEELSQRLEKSEAGRKKLRQAIAILQEKLDGMEKVLKINEKLRQECEQERKRAESEKQKAEEEKRLKSALEKDSTSLKNQLAKVLQRIGAVENKQKSDKKELERLQNEVKLSIEGMRVASQAVNSIQNSCQALETTMVEKVSAAFDEAHAATQAVNQVQGSLQSIEHVLATQGSSPRNETATQLIGRAPQKLVDEISRLFNKERQSHCKIEHRLSMLKSAFDLGRSHHSQTNSENIIDLESLAFTKKKKENASKKRKSRGEETAVVQRVKKKREESAEAERNSEVNGIKFVDHDDSLNSPHLTVQQRVSEERGSVRSYNTSSNDFNEEAIVNHRDSSTGNAHVVSLNETSVKPTDHSNDSRLTITSKGCQKIILSQNKCSSEVLCEDFSPGMHAGGEADQEEHQQTGISTPRGTADAPSDNNASDSDLDSLEEWWYSSERILLSPSLPEICSPDLTKGPSQSCGCFESIMGSRFSSDSLVQGAPTFSGAANSENDFGCPLETTCIPDTTDACDGHFDVEPMRSGSCVNNSHGTPLSPEKQQILIPRAPSSLDMDLETSTELRAKVVTQRDQWNQDTLVKLPETGISAETDHDECISYEINASVDVPFRNNHIPGLSQDPDPVLASRPANENSVRPSHQEVIQFDDCMLGTVNDAPLAELDDFLKVLPPLPISSPKELCCLSNLSPSAHEKPLYRNCSYDQVPASNQTLIAGKMKILPNNTENGLVDEVGEKACHLTDAEHVNEGCSQGIDAEQVIDPFSQQLPTQEELCNLVSAKRRDVMDTSNSVVIQESQPSTFQACSPCKSSSLNTVFLVQAFDIQDAEAKVTLMAACILVNSLEHYFVHEIADKGKVFKETMEFKSITEIPLLYVSCSLISSVVIIARARQEEADGIAAAKPIHTLLQAYVAFIRRTFVEKANMVLNAILAQLSGFLIQGKAMRLTLQGLTSACDDALDVARVMHNHNQCSYHFIEANLEDVHAGGKVLATLCQVLACVTHLQNIVYEVLGWCDKDVIWLLTVFSSFSSICGDTAFMAEADDLLGHAICAIIIELMASVEQEVENVTEKKVNKATQSLPTCEQRNLVSWVSLRKALKTGDKRNISQVVIVAFGALEYLLGSAKDLRLPFLRTGVTCKVCLADDNGRREKNQLIEAYSGDFTQESCLSQKVPTICEIMPVGYGTRRDSALEFLGPQKWEKKYVETVGALELIAQFMGWDWTYNHLIGGYLWTMVAPDSNQIHVAGVLHIVSCLTRIGAKRGGTDLPGLTELKECVSNLLLPDSTLAGKAKAVLLSELQQPSQCAY